MTITNTRTHWRKAVFSVFLFLLLLPALCGYAADTSLYSFLPLDSPIIISVDLPILWESTAGLRNNPMFGGGIRDIEEGMGLSFEKEILPWAGQAGLALTDTQFEKPGSALLIQIRDPERMIAQERLLTLLQQAMKNADAAEWQALDYKGVAISHAEIARGKSLFNVNMATLDGWLVIAAGDGVIQKVIDTRNGSIPSLEKHPLFNRMMDGLPPNAIGKFYFNAQRIIAKQQRDAEAVVDVAEPETFLFAGAVDYANDNLQFDTIYCTSSVKIQSMLQKFNADVGTISGASLAQLPEGAFATLLIANPDKWVAAVEEIMQSSAENVKENGVEQEPGILDEVRAVLRRCSGEVGVSAAWRDGEGFGMTVAGQTGADTDAGAAAAGLGNILQHMQMPVAENDNLYSVPALANDEAVFPLLPCWTARKQWLLGATHPGWLPKQEEKPALELPELAKNANLAIFGDFSFIQPMMKSMGMDENILAIMSGMKLFTGKWVIAVKIDEDGGAVKCHLSGGLPVMAMSAAVLYPVFAKAREKARQTASVSNLRQLVLYEIMYAQDHDEFMPAVTTMEDMKKLMDIPDQLLVSPRTNEPYTLNPAVAGIHLGQIDNPATMIVIYENTPGPDGTRCAAFLDGHVIAIPAVHWETYKQQANIP